MRSAPVLGRKLEVAVSRPVRQDAQDLLEVLERIERVEPHEAMMLKIAAAASACVSLP